MADAPTLEDFQAEVTAFLDANAAPKAAAATETASFEWGQGSDDVALFEEVDREAEKAAIVRAKEWRAKRFDAGLGWITGPTEFGGRELTSAHERIYTQAEGRYEIPDTSYFGIGLGMVAPTIHAHAQPHVQERYLPKLYRGDIIASQLFSEPGAGSDLASLQTRGRSATATSGSSPVRRSGPRARTTATSARSSVAPTPTCRSTRVSRASSST